MITENGSQSWAAKAWATTGSRGEASGRVVMFGKDRALQGTEKQMVVTAAGFLGSQMEQ